jgi:hypothetical protein
LLTVADLKTLARARLADANVLVRARRFDAGFYVCGYAVELALKARICRTLKWSAFPEKRSEFDGFQSFKTHALDVLLRLSGREHHVKVILFREWTIVSNWRPEIRYQPRGTISAATAQEMIAAARTLLVRL